MKYILVVEKEQGTCIGCPCYNIEYFPYCGANEDYTGDMDECSLKPLPQPRCETIGDDIADHEAHGWNALLELIQNGEDSNE